MRFRRRWRLRVQMDTRVHPLDILANRALAAAIFWLPIFAIAATGYSEVGIDVRTWVWTGGCVLMAAGSLVNAMRCGRLQSYLLTPLFLLGALASFAYGTGLLALGPAGWGLIGYGLLAGLCLVSPLPELFLGRYR
ncbi:MAG: hypothetical protein KGO02_21300 [Alphaproteobacteria bacterium]|nr:hypothetical protein [Alphaproteobacteria bacterium]